MSRASQPVRRAGPHGHHEGHGGAWQECQECRRAFKTEMYVWFGTNEYNFEILQNPPEFEPTICAGCGRIIHLGTEGYMRRPDGAHFCEVCSEIMRRDPAPERGPRPKKN